MVLDFKNNKIWAKFYGFYTFYEYLRAVERLTKGCMCKNDILGGCKYNFRQFAEQKSKKYWKNDNIFNFPKATTSFNWAFWQSDFVHTGHGMGILKEKTFREVLGTFRGQNVQKSGFLGKKWSFWPFSRSYHRLQFGPFDIPISHARAMELGFWRKRHFGMFWAHLGVQTSKKVDFWEKNGHFDHFPEATTGFNLGLLTFRFCVLGAWNLDLWAHDVSGGIGHI